MLKIGWQEMSKYNKKVTMKSEFLIGGGGDFRSFSDENFSSNIIFIRRCMFMLMDILMEALMSMDEDTLDSVLESCDSEELEIIDSAMEMKVADRSNPAVQNYVKFMKGVRDQNKNPRDITAMGDDAALRDFASGNHLNYSNTKFSSGNTIGTLRGFTVKRGKDGEYSTTNHIKIEDTDMKTIKSTAKDITRKAMVSQKIKDAKDVVDGAVRKAKINAKYSKIGQAVSKAMNKK